MSTAKRRVIDMYTHLINARTSSDDRDVYVLGVGCKETDLTEEERILLTQSEEYLSRKMGGVFT